MIKSKRRRLISLVVSLVLVITAVPAMAPVHEAAAASKYIKVDAFIEYLVTELQLPVDMNSKQPYIDAAMKAGILKNDDFKDYTVYLTRTDCAVLANRADEYINGSHYGFTDEVYEFLSGCEYYNGKLYYNVKGVLYPQGEIRETYEASRFLEDVLLPLLDRYFRFEKGLRAGYEEVTNSDGSEKNQYIQIGYVPADPRIIYEVDPFDENDYLIQAWKKIIDGERRVQAVYNKRISDLNKIPESKRQDVAEIVAKGIIKGYSNGLYIQNRQFRGSNKITASGARGVVALVLDQYSRALISPDGQLIRTTNLPKNFYEYPYILECFPNDFYEMKYDYAWMNDYKNGTMDKSDYDLPSEVSNESIKKKYKNQVALGMEPYEYYDTIMKQANQYLNCVFNVNYRTVGDSWVEKVASSYVPFSGDSIYNRVERYLEAMKTNHVIVESKVIALEPSTLYRYTYSYYIRAYVKYRITADTVKVEEDYDLVFGNKASTYLVGSKNGEWNYGYYDIPITGSNVNNQSYMEFGMAPWAGISDGIYKGSK